MKTITKEAIRNEKGHALTLVLVLLVVGGLILTPLLGLMSTGLVSGQVYEKKTNELYGADAGVEDACWQLKQTDPDPAKVPASPEEPPLTYPLQSLNDKKVEVTIDMISGTVGDGIYKVTSTATSTSGSKTTIVSYVQTIPIFWTNAITSTADVRLEPDSEVYGNVMGNITVDKGTVDGDIRGPYDADKWPFSEDFSAVYWPQASNATIPDTKCCGGSCVLDVSENSTSGIYELGPGFAEADKQEFIIKSTRDNITVTLTGTVYIKGNDATLNMGGGGQPFYLDLNNQTIYVEGRNHNLSKPNEHAFYMPPGKVTIIGSGAIIAEGNIDFQPHMEACSEDEFVFVMSLFGGVNFQPKGTMYGSVAGHDVEVGSNSILTYTDPPRDPDTGECLLNFPWDIVERTVKILTWEVNPQ
jgi:hypothetical protein